MESLYGTCFTGCREESSAEITFPSANYRGRKKTRQNKSEKQKKEQSRERGKGQIRFGPEKLFTREKSLFQKTWASSRAFSSTTYGVCRRYTVKGTLVQNRKKHRKNSHLIGIQDIFSKTKITAIFDHYVLMETIKVHFYH